MGAEDDQHADVERLGRVRPRHVLVLHLRAVEHRGVQKAHAARAAGCVDDGTDAGPERSGHLQCRRCEPRDLQSLAEQARYLGSDGVPVTPVSAGTLLRAHGQHAAASFDLAVLGTDRVAVRQSVSDAARSGALAAESAGVGENRAGDAPRCRARRAGRRQRGPGVCRARSQDRRDPRKAALDDGQGSRHMRTQRAAWWFVAPALLVIGVFFFLPVLAALAMSLTDFDLYALNDFGDLRWIGFENYARLLREPLFWKALGNTFYFVVLGVPLSIAVSLGAALLVNSKVARFRGMFRTVYFAPVVTTLVAVAVVWRYIFHTRYGFLNYSLASVGLDPIDWMGDPRFAMPAIVILAVWKNFGYNMIILLAALQNIPDDLYEAARIDGASGWQQFRHVTLPGIGPVLLLVSILTMTGYFQLFAEPYVMTEGGPLQATYSVLYFMFDEGFKWWSLGRASAVAFLLFILMFIVTIVQLRLGRERSGA